MATFLAHIKVHEGKEKRFEEIAKELFSATHEKEDDVVRYEYWRGSESQTYYTSASFKDYLGFLKHQVSSHHEELAAELREITSEIKIEWVDPVQGASELLTEKGLFAVIIPYKEELGFVELAKSVGLFPNRITRVKGNPDADFKRSLMEFSFDANKPHIDTLIIEEGRHQYTKEYIRLTEAFYLKM